jgi:hypothetical protein
MQLCYCREVLMKQTNYILKVIDAKKPDIRKALKDAGIEVKALTEVYSEDIENIIKEETKDGEETSEG